MEPPEIGSQVVFRYGREVLRGSVTGLPSLAAVATPGAAVEEGRPGIMMRSREGVYEYLFATSYELLRHEGVYWARGWDTEDALALRAQVRLNPENTGSGGNYATVGSQDAGT